MFFTSLYCLSLINQKDWCQWKSAYIHFSIIFTCSLKCRNSFKSCDFWANLRCEYAHVRRLTDVNNCSVSHPGCILQNQLRSRPAEEDCFYGPPNEAQVLLGSHTIPWNKLSPRELSAPSLLQWDLLADRCCGLQIWEDALLYPLSNVLLQALQALHSSASAARSSSSHLKLIFQRLNFFSPFPLSFSLICKRRKLAWS